MSTSSNTVVSGPMAWLSRLAPAAYAILRVGAGFLFLQHGLQKLFGWFGDKGAVELMSLMGLAGVLELGGGILLMLGLFTRPVAFLLCGQMIVAYLMAHAPNGLWPIVNKGELALLYGLVWGFFATHGAGPYSLDSRRRS